MSENKPQSEQELWDVLSEPVTTETKAEPVKKPAPRNKEVPFPFPLG